MSLEFLWTCSHYCKRCLGYWQCIIQGGRVTGKGAREGWHHLPLFIRYAIAFPKAIFRFHLAQLCYMTIPRRSGKYLAFIAHVLGAGKGEGFEYGYWIGEQCLP